MALIHNSYKESPLAANISMLGAAEDPEWIEAELTLYRDYFNKRVAYQSTEQVSVEDIKRLIKGLRKITQEGVEDYTFATIDPFFLIDIVKHETRLSKQRLFRFIIWVDQGMLENNLSTDTGLGLVMLAETEILSAFADQLEKELEETLKPT